MPRKKQPFVNFQPSDEEKEILEAFCKAQDHTKTRVLRDLIRTLPDYREKTVQLTVQNLMNNV